MKYDNSNAPLNKWDELKPLDQAIGSSKTHLLNEFINPDQIMAGLLEKILKGTVHKSKEQQVKHYKKVKSDFKNQLSDIEFILRPMLTESNFTAINAAFKHSILYVEAKIQAIENEAELVNPLAIKRTQGIKEVNWKKEFDEFTINLKNVINANLSSGISSTPKATDEQILSRKEVAKMLQVSQVTISTWMKEGRLKHYRISRRVFFKKSDIEMAFLSAKAKKGLINSGQKG